MSIVAVLEKRELRPEQELAALLTHADGDGAVLSFVGLARPTSKDGANIDKLVLEHHQTLTRQSLEEVASATAERFDLSHVRVIHRCGELARGEAIVFAGVAARHRRAVFEAADYLMDRLKTEAVFWKREVSERGSECIEPAEADHSDRERWG